MFAHTTCQWSLTDLGVCELLSFGIKGKPQVQFTLLLYTLLYRVARYARLVFPIRMMASAAC
eukprot:4340061-Amphidinium_carterae.1